MSAVKLRVVEASLDRGARGWGRGLPRWVWAAVAFACVATSGSVAIAVTYTYNYTGTIETFTPPAGIIGGITISGTGAAGGNSGVIPGGRGARITGTFSLGPTDTFNILVGQKGSDGGDHAGPGGGGGTFAWIGVNRLIVAGGGGGAANPQAGIDASTAEEPSPRRCRPK